MKRFLLFAGNENSNAVGVNGLVSDFDSLAEAFLSIVDQQTPSKWWHVLDTQTGQVFDREHLRTKDNTLTFVNSDRIAGTSTPRVAIIPPAKPLDDLEASLRTVVEASVKPNGQGRNGYANGSHG